MTREEIVTQLNTMIRPPRPDVIEAVATFVEGAIAGTFDPEKAAVEAKQAQIVKLEERMATLQADVATAVEARPDLAELVAVKGGVK